MKDTGKKMVLAELEKLITPPDKAAGIRCRERWDSLAKPLGGLGVFERQIVRMAELFGSEDIDISKRAVVVVCSDNGVVAQGVSQTGSEVTAIVAQNIADGNASVCRMAKAANADVFVVDAGMNTHPMINGLISRPVADGTADITEQAAMTAEQCRKAVELGIDMVKELKEKGYTLIATGEMGIGNTTTAAALCCALLDLPCDDMVGRGAGLDDRGLLRKQNAVKKALERCCGITEPFELLRQLGGFDIAAMAGMFIGGAVYNCAVLIDGLISAAAALAAVRMIPKAKKAIFASHLSSEPAAALILRELGLPAVITAGMHLGEGTGAVAVMPLFDMALCVYNDASTFQRIGMQAYENYSDNEKV